MNLIPLGTWAAEMQQSPGVSLAGEALEEAKLNQLHGLEDEEYKEGLFEYIKSLEAFFIENKDRWK